jgi:branched-chain amino acid transport system ATP-binding protein
MNDNALLEVSEVDGGYRKTQVLNAVSLRLLEHERLGLFGPNGHGKTTLLRAISGLIAPWRGKVSFRGRPIAGLGARRIVESGIIHVAQGTALFPQMTVAENLWLAAQSKHARPLFNENLERVFNLFPRVHERRTQLCRSLSGGERQMVAIATGLMSAPKLLMLDEPTLGLAPRVKEILANAIRAIAASEVAMIIVDQDIEFLLSTTQRLVMLDHGTISEEFAADTHVNQQEILSMYFGRA